MGALHLVWDGAGLARDPTRQVLRDGGNDVGGVEQHRHCDRDRQELEKLSGLAFEDERQRHRSDDQQEDRADECPDGVEEVLGGRFVDETVPRHDHARGDDHQVHRCGHGVVVTFPLGEGSASPTSLGCVTTRAVLRDRPTPAGRSTGE